MQLIKIGKLQTKEKEGESFAGYIHEPFSAVMLFFVRLFLGKEKAFGEIINFSFLIRLARTARADKGSRRHPPSVLSLPPLAVGGEGERERERSPVIRSKSRETFPRKKSAGKKYIQEIRCRLGIQGRFLHLKEPFFATSKRAQRGEICNCNHLCYNVAPGTKERRGGREKSISSDNFR